MLRIGQFTDTFLPITDGVGRVALSYAETLSRMGHQVTVVSPMYDTGFRGGYPFELVDFQAMKVPTMNQYKTGEAPMDAHYRARMRMIQLDILHAHAPFTAGSEALRLSVLRKIPLVGTFHSRYYDDFFKATKSEKMAKLGVKFVVDFYERCDEVWAVGHQTADILYSYGYRGDIEVMPNGVTLREAKADAVSEIERRYGLGDLPMLLFVGQMNFKKNIRRLLEACAALRRAGVEFRLLLAGQGPDEKDIARLIGDLNLKGCAYMTGHVTDSALLDALYARATLFLFPSLYDMAPMVVREAAVMGTPSVMVRGSASAEIVRDGENGLLCDDDSDALSHVIESALRDRERLDRIGQCAKETIPVPWERVMEKSVERYERLILMGWKNQLKKKTLRVI